MPEEFASPAECLPGLPALAETRDFGVERASEFAQRLRELVLRPQTQLGAPLYVELDDVRSTIMADGTVSTLSSAHNGYAVASDIIYAKSPDVRGYLRFNSRAASAVREVYVPDDRRFESKKHERSVDDIVEAKTGKRIQVALSWDNEFWPDNHDQRVSVHKRYYCLGESEDGPTTEVLCLAVYEPSIALQQFVYVTTFEETEVLEAIDEHFVSYRAPVSTDDLERIERRVLRNVNGYKALADIVRIKYGNQILQTVSRFGRNRSRWLNTPDILSGLLQLRLLAQDEHEEDDPADGSDGDFSIFFQS